MAQAYGPDGLGILTIAGVPELPELRRRLLPLSARFVVSALPPCMLPYMRMLCRGVASLHARNALALLSKQRPNQCEAQLS